MIFCVRSVLSLPLLVVLRLTGAWRSSIGFARATRGSRRARQLDFWMDEYVLLNRRCLAFRYRSFKS